MVLPIVCDLYTISLLYTILDFLLKINSLIRFVSRINEFFYEIEDRNSFFYYEVYGIKFYHHLYKWHVLQHCERENPRFKSWDESKRWTRGRNSSSPVPFEKSNFTNKHSHGNICIVAEDENRAACGKKEIIKHKPWGTRGQLGKEIVMRLSSQESNGFSRMELSNVGVLHFSSSLPRFCQLQLYDLAERSKIGHNSIICFETSSD